MAKIVATFSNGFTDTYKGARAVRAAWMVVERATGKVYASGHSLDRVRAQKTAESSICPGSYWHVPRAAMYAMPDWVRYIRPLAIRDGVIAEGEKVGVHELLRRLKADNARRNADRRALYTVEVVDL